MEPRRTARRASGSSPAHPWCTVTLLLCLALASDAHAYIDPGSGTLLWQALLAALFGGMFYIRRIINWVRERIGVGRDKIAAKD